MTVGPRIQSSPRSPGPTSALASSFMILAEQLATSSPTEDASLVEITVLKGENSVNWIDSSVLGCMDASGGPVMIAQAVNLTLLLAACAGCGLSGKFKDQGRRRTLSCHILGSRPLFLSRQSGHR